MVLLSIFSSMLLYIIVVKNKLWNNLCSYSLYFLPRCFNYPNPKPLFSFFFFSFSYLLVHFFLIFLFSFSFTLLHIKPHAISFSYIYYFSFPGHLTFNASSCISSHMKLLEYHASSWHRHASHLMVCWLMSSH